MYQNNDDGMIKNKDVPGPGHYKLNGTMDKGKGISFGSGNRNETSQERHAKGIPGPGTYKVPDFVGNDTKGVVIAGKIEEKIPDRAPGPGQYHSPNKRNEGPSYSISGHRTDDPIMKEKQKIPPPDSYNPDDSYVRQKAPTITFGSKPKDTKLEQNPGPGAYALKTTLAGPSIYIGEKHQAKSKELSPGPAAYNPKNLIPNIKPVHHLR
jgi:hypothetical protein